MVIRIATILFPLGQLVATANAVDQIPDGEMSKALQKHATGDWGLCCEEDWAANDDALKNGFRLLSVYESEAGIRFWIITEHDRSVTTFLLPEDY